MKRILPYPIVYVEQIEQWLNDMALKGYHLKSIGRFAATFIKGEKKQVNHQVIFHKDQEDDNLKELGYTLLLENQFSYNFNFLGDNTYYTSIYIKEGEDKDVPISDTKKDVIRRIINSGLSPLLTVLVLMLYWGIRFALMGIDQINIEFAVLSLSVLIPLFSLCILRIVYFIKQRNIVRYYKGKKKNINPPKKWLSKAVRAFEWAMIIWLMVVAVNMMTLSFANRVFDNKNGDIIAIKQIEGEHNIYLSDEYRDEVEEVKKLHTILLPEYYYISDLVHTKEDGNGLIYYSVEYARYRINKMADFSHSLWIDRVLDVTRVETEYYSTDYYIVGEKLYIYMQCSNEIIKIVYMGERQPEEIINNIYEFGQFYDTTVN